ncbi:cytochrome P450 2U1-like [Gigantopelta aegis]|uniref:cytochrome P450 2U1-like n=1 Tax=Gigantopelta aegis TaxID=1735272 RepID=UPI001B88AB95|nr:cytochrome P450 2U1-like [Gigantopelta aegis]
MIQSTMDLINGGLVTSLSGLEFIFLYLLHNPDVQRRVQAEIDDVIGSDRQPSWDDRSALPYTTATIVESLRLGCVSPSTLPHVATEDSTIEDYHVPKGTHVLASLFCLHRQPDVFEDPESFRPERHVDIDGSLKNFENMMPFGVAPRFCLGDDWFHVFAFLIVTSVLQRYSLGLPAGKELPPFTTRMRVVRRLVPFTVVLTSRSAT